jgi:pimeloyl-ACP methyl ester carboxylesterase
VANFLLVHGTSCGAWIWRLLSPLFQAAGHEVFMPTLTGLGASSHLLPKIDRITLATHIQDIINMIFYEDLSDVVLVGNSYAGMVITGVAAKEPRRLAHLVYLDAYVPFVIPNN